MFMKTEAKNLISKVVVSDEAAFHILVMLTAISVDCVRCWLTFLSYEEGYRACVSLLNF
jgi:hypothetical protein